MSTNNPKFHRKSIRLPEYDYSQEGVYYVTICAQDRKCIFGEIADGRMVLNRYGEIADQYWKAIPLHFPNVFLDEYIRFYFDLSGDKVRPPHPKKIILVSI